MEFQFADYFENEVLRKRSFLKRDWAIKVIENPLNSEEQPDGRVRYWGRIEEFDDKVFRVVVLADGRTILNMFPDRSFKQ